jgi:hypothetical protein
MSRAITSLRPFLSAVMALALSSACMPPQEEEQGPPTATGGRSGSGGAGGQAGKGSGGSGGGSGGSGGAASGGSGAGGSGAGGIGGSAEIGSGGSGGGGSSGSGGSSGDAAAPAMDGPPAEGTWANLELAISGCVFCHPGEVAVARNSDFSDPTKLHDVLMGTTTHVTASCQFKTLVVPGKPMESLLYLKLVDPVPAGCGVRMPMGKASDAWVTAVVKNWIMAGAPAK